MPRMRRKKELLLPKEEVRDIISDNIHNIREKKKIKIFELSKKTGISSQYLCKIEKKACVSIPIYTLLLIAAGLEVPFMDLLKGVLDEKGFGKKIQKMSDGIVA